MQLDLPACSASAYLFNTILWLYTWDVAFKLKVNAVLHCNSSILDNSLACIQSSLLAHALSSHSAGYIEYNAHQKTLLNFRSSKLSYGL